jgi:flagellar biosynthetic protein FliR
MDIQIIIQPLLEMLSVYVWPFIRIGAFMVVMPLVGGGFVPTRIRLLLAVVLTMLVAPIVPVPLTLDVLSPAGLVTIIQEVGIGLIMGFLVQLVFDAIALGGQIIAMGMGLGFAVFIDRARGVNIPVLSQLFLMLASLIFLALDGHLTMIRILALSFHSWPISNPGLSMPVLQDLLLWTGQLFVFALKVALPAVTSILVVNLSFGVMSRAAPTLNLFAVGFPITMLLGFTVVFLTMGTLTENMSMFLLEALASISQLFEI